MPSYAERTERTGPVRFVGRLTLALAAGAGFAWLAWESPPPPSFANGLPDEDTDVVPAAGRQREITDDAALSQPVEPDPGASLDADPSPTVVNVGPAHHHPPAGDDEKAGAVWAPVGTQNADRGLRATMTNKLANPRAPP